MTTNLPNKSYLFFPLPAFWNPKIHTDWLPIVHPQAVQIFPSRVSARFKLKGLIKIQHKNCF